VNHQSTSKFFNQLLNVQDERDIYAAWEKDHRGVIDDYEHTVGQPRIKADLTSWVDVMPNVLILQLNRTKFE
jgi:hypothetical protein